jgi:hopanoid C-3 methylase
MSPPPAVTQPHQNSKSLYVYGAGGRRSRAIDDATESFVEETGMVAG